MPDETASDTAATPAPPPAPATVICPRCKTAFPLTQPAPFTTPATAPALATAQPAHAHTTAQPAAPAPRFSKLSTLTLLLALLWIPCLLAILCGHIARARIRRSKGALTGGGVALFGLILGYLGLLAGIAAIAGGLWVWRATSDIRADIAAGKDPTAAIVNRLGGPLTETLLKSEALLPENVRAQIDTALDNAADERLSLTGQWLLQQAAENNGKLPDTLADFGKKGPPLPALPALPAQTPLPAQAASSASGQASPLAGLDFSQLDLSQFSSFITRGLIVVPGLTTTMPPDTVAVHYSKPLADGSVPVFLLNGSTARLQPGDPRLAALKLEKTGA